MGYGGKPAFPTDGVANSYRFSASFPCSLAIIRENTGDRLAPDCVHHHSSDICEAARTAIAKRLKYLQFPSVFRFGCFVLPIGYAKALGMLFHNDPTDGGSSSKVKKNRHRRCPEVRFVPDF
jgi:hypothetical protein